MAFNIDKQTAEELNLLGKFKSGSIYGLFNKVKTSGGEQLLSNMFQNPLEDMTAINERSAVIQSFELSQLNFPFDVQQIALMQEYLDTGIGKNSLVTLGELLVKKLLAGLTRDERYKQSIQGLHAVIATLQKAQQFLKRVEGTNIVKSPYMHRLQVRNEVLKHPDLDMLRGVDIYKSLSLSLIAKFDQLLKNGLSAQMEQLLAFVSEVDVFIAVSDVSRESGFHYAKALPAELNELKAKGLRHPGISNGVGNALELTRENNVLFLTGANMAGKSTLMKSIGINLYLGQMGFPVGADEMEFSLREGLYSSINVADNINLGYSHFYAEVIRVKQAAEAAASGKRLLLMFDELFKGTNVKDAFDGTLAVTEAFAEYEECLFIVSTHIIEVGEVLSHTPNIQFGYMPTVMDGMRPQYTYQLTKGITKDRQGMLIIENEGILELLK